MVTSPDLRHVPTGRLALLAQGLGRVFASATTWHGHACERGGRRPRLRHPQQPRLGVRAFWPDETWHIDTPLVRFLGGAKAYLPAVIDNFSRRILAWRVAGTFDPSNALAVLVEAGRHAAGGPARPPGPPRAPTCAVCA